MRVAPFDGMLAFITVAEKRGFSAAARSLGVSASALSQAVRALEARVNAPLLVRTTRAVSLTDAGERLYRRAAPGLREAAAAIAEVGRGETDVVGRIRLTIPHIAAPFVEPWFVPLHQKHPGLVLEVLLEDQFVDLIQHGYDAGIRLVESMAKDMVAVRVAPAFRFVIVASPEYLRQRKRPKHPRELVEHDCIGFRAMSTGALYRWEFERRGREFNVPVQGPLISNEASMMVSGARKGLGLAYVPDFCAADAITAKELVTVLDEFMPSAPGLFLYFPSRSKDQPKMRALLAAIRASRRG